MGVVISNDIIGQKFGRLIIESLVQIKKRTWLNCRCDCGNSFLTLKGRLRNGNTKSCGCLKKEVVTAKNKRGFTGCGDLTGQYFGQVKWNAGLRNLEFNITVQYAWDLFLKQDKKCALSGVELVFGTKRKADGTASLDRIDSSIGYIEGNLQWIHKQLNRMKGDLSDAEFLEWCRRCTNKN
jgi:hypothetical protein